jgi:TonB-linked SusC/RagA family outer membrane protein
MGKKKFTLFLLLILTGQTYSFLWSQSDKINLDLKESSLLELFSEIEKNSDYRFFYSNDEIDVKQTITINAQQEEIGEILRKTFSNLPYVFKELRNKIILVEFKSESATTEQKSLTGIVRDEFGEPLPGVSVVVKGTNTGTITDFEGNYSLMNVSVGDVLQFSYIGMKTQEIPVGNQNIINISLVSDAIGLEEVVAVGYGVQKKATLTGAVVAVGGTEIVQSKNENVKNMLTGRVAGLNVVQTSSEPGAFLTQFNLRGMGNPLIVIDGIPRDNLERLDANDIESISVLKDASAAIYGVRAANGVILVNTKRGLNTENKPTLTYNSNYTWQYTSGLPRTVNGLDFLIMSNEKGMNNPLGGNWAYPQELIDEYANGTRKSTDWWNETIREGAPIVSNNLNVSGGSDRTKYYFSFGNFYQEGIFKSNDFDYKRYNLRSNISSQITDNLTLTVNLNGISDKKGAASTSSSDIIYAMWRQYSIAPVYANDNPIYYARPDAKDNPVQTSRISEVGYNNISKKWFQSLVSLEYKAPFLKGLSTKASLNYDYNQNTGKNYPKAYTYYEFEPITEAYQAILINSPTTLTRSFTENTSLLYQFQLNYENTFSEVHNVKVTGVAEGVKKEGDGFFAKREFAIDVDELFAGNEENQIGNQFTGDRYRYATMSYVGRLNYDYAGKYLLEASFRYDGSSKFPASNRWGFFPAVSGGYRISQESFWKNSRFLSHIDNLKVRASHGILGDDRVLDYQFISGYSYPAYVIAHNGTPIPGGYFYNGTYVNGIQSTGIPNNSITWYESKMSNIGLDVSALEGLIGGSLDVFSRKRSGLLATSNAILPGTVGADLPLENLNSDRAYGFELQLTHANKIGEFAYNVSGNLSVARTKNDFVQQSPYRNSYLNWRNNLNDRYNNIWWGYGAGGQFTSWDQIAEFPVSTARQLPGDYYYEDWNGDGFIDDKDIHPIGYNSQPMLNFGLNLNMSLKGFDLNILFQGASMSNVEYNSILRTPFWGFQSAPITRFLDRWRPIDPNADPYDQYTTWTSGVHPMMGSASPALGSAANMENGKYVRLKNLEFGYTVSEKFGLKRAGIDYLRFYLNAYNLLTFSPLDYVDPEHPSGDEYLYPLNRTVSLGLNCKF